MTRHSEPVNACSIDRLQRQLQESIEQSKEMTRRSQELLDRHRGGGKPLENEDESRDEGEAA